MVGWVWGNVRQNYNIDLAQVYRSSGPIEFLGPKSNVYE